METCPKVDPGVLREAEMVWLILYTLGREMNYLFWSHRPVCDGCRSGLITVVLKSTGLMPRSLVAGLGGTKGQVCVCVCVLIMSSIGLTSSYSL